MTTMTRVASAEEPVVVSGEDLFYVHIRQYEAISGLCRRYARSLRVWVERIVEKKAYELMNERTVPPRHPKCRGELGQEAKDGAHDEESGRRPSKWS